VDIVVNVQGDEPIIEPAMIDEAVAPLVRDGSIPVGTLVRKIESDDELTNPGIVKVVLDRNSNGMYFSRSPIPFGRDLHPKEWLKHHTYYKHFGLYVFRREFLTTFKNLAQSQYEKAEKLEQLRILEGGYKIRCTITSFDSVTVDTQKDLDKVRAIVSQRARQK
jgi:3-deoxy-manno-octulosonate cytidylyltransferase (CMP-KDO synthetase)